MATGTRDALTVRFPPDLLARAKEVRNPDESLNQLIVSALEREITRREGLRTLREIDEVRDRIAARTGPQPDSTPTIRALRDGISLYE